MNIKYLVDVSKMVFVFGSNELGIHGGGAARAAREEHGAVYMKGFGGQGFGPQGGRVVDGSDIWTMTTFALPTCSRPTGGKDFEISKDLLRYYIYCFILLAKMAQQFAPHIEFQVTRVGCGLAGWTDSEVAPLFAEAPDNCYFDSKWDDPVLLPGRKYWGTAEDGTTALIGAGTNKYPNLIDGDVLVIEPKKLNAGN